MAKVKWEKHNYGDSTEVLANHPECAKLALDVVEQDISDTPGPGLEEILCDGCHALVGYYDPNAELPMFPSEAVGKFTQVEVTLDGEVEPETLVVYPKTYDFNPGGNSELKMEVSGFYRIEVKLHFKTLDKHFFFTVDSYGEGADTALCFTREQTIEAICNTYGAPRPSKQFRALIDRLLISDEGIKKDLNWP